MAKGYVIDASETYRRAREARAGVAEYDMLVVEGLESSG